MKFVKKLQKLPEKKKITILWSVVIILGLFFSVWRINLFISEMGSIGKNDFQTKIGIRNSQEKFTNEMSEVKKSFDVIKESTDTMKEGFGLMRDLIEKMGKMEEISPDDYPEFLIENNN